MARMTAQELEIQDVLDRWLREDAGIRMSKHDREYTSLVATLEAFLKRRTILESAKFEKAVEVAYQNGYNAGLGVKG